MNGLPRGWAQVKLADVAMLKTGPFGSTLGKKDYINRGNTGHKPNAHRGWDDSPKGEHVNLRRDRRTPIGLLGLGR